jgi:glycosyltransferase involved in cell wall biosynthesis
MRDNNDVTVVIPTYNRNELLNQVLPSYIKQKHVSEIVIIDDGSSVPIESSFFANGNSKPIRILRNQRNMGSCSARNSGILAAKSKWILFGEDDLILSENHVENLFIDMRRLGADIICGDIIQQDIYQPLKNSWEKTAKKKFLPVLNPKLITINYGCINEPVEIPFAHAIFLAPTEVVKKYLFNTRIGGPSFFREDQELQLTLRKAGYRLFATPNAVGLHLARSKSHGSGTRLNNSFFIHIFSSIVNTWQVLKEYHHIIAPFFKGMSKNVMIRRAIFWMVIIEIKRRLQLRYPFIYKYIKLFNK